MKIAAHIVATLLGLAFIAFSAMILFHLVTPPPMPEDSLVGKFMAAFAPTGWLMMVKTFEMIGGILVLIPKTRNLGLLVLGPILINILAFHVFVEKNLSELGLPVVLSAMALFLLFVERKAFAGLVNRS